MKTINYNEWFEEYKPHLNHFTSSPDNDNFIFETFGEELKYVKQQNNKNIWTEISRENEEFWIIPGYHFIDRIGFYITEKPWENENIQVNNNEMISGEKARKHCFNFWESQGFIFDENQISGYFSKYEYSTGEAKYITRDLYLDLMELDELTGVQEDALHDYFSQL